MKLFLTLVLCSCILKSVAQDSLADVNYFSNETLLPADSIFFKDSARIESPISTPDSISLAYAAMKIKIPRISEDSLRAYKSDSDFNYEPEKSGLLESFVRWLQYLWDQMFGKTDTTKGYELLDWLIYIASALIVIYIIFRFVQGDRRWFLTPSSRKVRLSFNEMKENIHDMNFEEEIGNAVGNKIWRKAIRLFYLWSLKELNDKKVIHWSPEKTNHEYEKEFKNTALLAAFKENTYLYEYVWYGDFYVDEFAFKKARKSFEEFIQQVKKS